MPSGLLILGVGGKARADRCRRGLVVLNKAALVRMEDVALDTVADLVVEEADTGRQLIGILLCGHVGHGTGTGHGIVNGVACPAFAVHDEAGVDLVHILADHGHGLAVMNAHKVKTQTVDVVFIRPVFDHFAHILAVHRALGGGVVAAAGLLAVAAVGSHTVVVLGDAGGEAGVHGIGMVVYDVHDHADARLVQRLDHRFTFLDTDVAVIGVGGVGAFGNTIVLGIVAPVELVAVIGRLVDGREVVHRVDLNVGNAELLEIIDTGGDVALAVKRGTRLGKRHKLAAILGADAGILVIGEVFYVNLPDDRVSLVIGENVLIVLPAFGINSVGIKVDNHGTVAVHTYRVGIGILSSTDLGAGRIVDVVGILEGIGVVSVNEVAADGGRPYTCPVIAVHLLFHLDRVEILSAFFFIRTGRIAFEDNPIRQRSPDLEGGCFGRIDRA